MLKKTTIIAAVAVILLAAGGFYLYKKGYLGDIFSISPSPTLSPEKLLTFEIKINTLTPAQVDLFNERFNSAKEALQKNPDDFNNWLYLGVIKKGVGDYEGARDVFLYAEQIRPKSSTPFANLADLYANFLNEPQKALEAIKTAIANDPNDFSFYLTLAEIYRYKIPGKEAMYEQTLLEAASKFPENPNIIAPLAAYYRQTNQIAKAIEWYEKLVKLAPENEMAKKDLEELRAKTK
jgi:cytochrome c-type biogenesis protein CcmH/NrfG